MRRSEERNTILNALRLSTEPMSPTELADVTGLKVGNVRRLLGKMVIDGEVVKEGRGRYWIVTASMASGNFAGNDWGTA